MASQDDTPTRRLKKPRFWEIVPEGTERPSIVAERRFKPGDRVQSTEHAPAMFRHGRKPRYGVVCKYWKNTLDMQVEWEDGLGPQTVGQDVVIRDRRAEEGDHDEGDERGQAADGGEVP